MASVVRIRHNLVKSIIFSPLSRGSSYYIASAGFKVNYVLELEAAIVLSWRKLLCRREPHEKWTQ
jgi:hypothetical protein